MHVPLALPVRESFIVVTGKDRAILAATSVVARDIHTTWNPAEDDYFPASKLFKNNF